jgi:hypothetical protein
MTGDRIHGVMQQELGQVADPSILISAGVTDGGGNMKNAASAFAGISNTFF